MDLRRLRYFLAVAEEGHFGRAAERLNIVQPALSMQIRTLEEELGGPLFVRTSRRVELTEAGKLLQVEARRTVEQAEHTKSIVQRSLKGETGCVRVGFAGNAVFSGKLMEDLRIFRKMYPDAELIIREMPPQAQVEAITAGQIDIGYAPDHNTMHGPKLICEQVGIWNRVAAMSAEHPSANKSDLTAAMLATEPLILYDSHEADERLYVALSRILGREPHVAYRSASTLSVLALAAAGFGVALVPEPLAQMAIPGLVYKILNEPELSANLMLLSRSDETNGAVCAFLTLIRNKIRESRIQ